MDDEPRHEADTLSHASRPVGEPEYGDFLLIDILRPDFRHFFSRYRVDLIGLVIVSAIVVLILVGTKWLAMIGADAAAGAGS